MHSQGDIKGTIRVEFKKKDGFYPLKVSDDGIGLPKDLNLTFGLSIINTLTKQINGELSLDSNNGTTFTIKIQGARINGIIMSACSSGPYQG